MKKFFCIIIYSLLLQISTPAQWQLVFERPGNEEFYDFVFNKNTGLLLGTKYTDSSVASVLYSTDDGSTWEEGIVHSPGLRFLQNANIINDSIFYASGGQRSGLTYYSLVKSTDAGKNWMVYNTYPEGYCDIFHFINEQKGVAVDLGGNNPSLSTFLTEDGAVTWDTVVVITSPGFGCAPSLILFDDLEGIIVYTYEIVQGNSELDTGMLRTTDGGRTWIECVFPFHFFWPGQSFKINENTCFLLGDLNGYSTILYTTDRGHNWDVYNPPEKFTSRWGTSRCNIFFASLNAGIVIYPYAHPTNDNVHYSITRDRGKTWTTPAPIPYLEYYSVPRIAVNTEGSIFVSAQLENQKIRIVKLEGNVLPVELTSFSAFINNNNVELSWTTATETNNRGFEVQRKKENNDWSVRGFVRGRGTTTEKQDYSFTDNDLKSGELQLPFKAGGFRWCF